MGIRVQGWECMGLLRRRVDVDPRTGVAPLLVREHHRAAAWVLRVGGCHEGGHEGGQMGGHEVDREGSQEGGHEVTPSSK